MVTNEAILKLIKPMLVPCKNETLKRKFKIRVITIPQNAPFNAKARKGVQGKNKGAKTIPAK
jgi:hypothetical protein